MKIFCIADTESDEETLGGWLKFCKKDLVTSDRIFHIGDGIKNIKKLFSKYKVIYIKGNHDSTEDCKIMEVKINIKGVNFYLFHGRRRNRIAEKINILSNHLKQKLNMSISLDSYYKQLFRTYKNKYDIVLYGHMHTPRIDRIENTIFIYPGSFSHKSSIKKPTYAIIHISEKKLKIKVFSVENKKRKIIEEKTINLYHGA